MITSTQTTPTIVHETDLQQHIEDTPLFWVYRNGRMQRLAWSAMTEQERAYQEEAERRDYFNSDFDPNYC